MEPEKFTVDTAKAANDKFILDAQEQMNGLSKSTKGLGGSDINPNTGLGAVPKPAQAPANQADYDTSAVEALRRGLVDAGTVMGDPNVSDSAKQAISSGL